MDSLLLFLLPFGFACLLVAWLFSIVRRARLTCSPHQLRAMVRLAWLDVRPLLILLRIPAMGLIGFIAGSVISFAIGWILLYLFALTLPKYDASHGDFARFGDALLLWILFAIIVFISVSIGLLMSVHLMIRESERITPSRNFRSATPPSC